MLCFSCIADGAVGPFASLVTRRRRSLLRFSCVANTGASVAVPIYLAAIQCTSKALSPQCRRRPRSTWPFLTSSRDWLLVTASSPLSLLARVLTQQSDQRTVGGLRFSSSTRLSTVLVDSWASGGWRHMTSPPIITNQAQQQPHRNQRLVVTAGNCLSLAREAAAASQGDETP